MQNKHPPFVELAKLLTNENELAMKRIGVLNKGKWSFFKRYERMFTQQTAYTLEEAKERFGENELFVLSLTASFCHDWLKFAVAVDDSIENEEIVWEIEEINENLGYDLEFETLAVEHLARDKMLLVLANHVQQQGYELLSLTNFYKDGHILFLVPISRKEETTPASKVIYLAEKIGWRFARVLGSKEAERKVVAQMKWTMSKRVLLFALVVLFLLPGILLLLGVVDGLV